MAKLPEIKLCPFYHPVITMAQTNPAFKAEVRPIIEKNGNDGLVLYQGVYHIDDEVLDVFYRYMARRIPVPLIPKRPRHANDSHAGDAAGYYFGPSKPPRHFNCRSVMPTKKPPKESA